MVTAELLVSLEENLKPTEFPDGSKRTQGYQPHYYSQCDRDLGRLKPET